MFIRTFLLKLMDFEVMSMRIVSSDYKKIVDVGSTEIWDALCATVKVLLSKKQGDIALAISFLSNGSCEAKNCIECAREINLIRDRLSQFPPNKVVYSTNDRSYIPNWAKSISPVITSCANFFLTADGNDLLFEIVCALTYGGLIGQTISLEG